MPERTSRGVGSASAIVAAAIILFLGSELCSAQALPSFPQCKDSSISMTTRTSHLMPNFGPYNRLTMVSQKKVSSGLEVESAPTIGAYRFKIPRVDKKQVFKTVGARAVKVEKYKPGEQVVMRLPPDKINKLKEAYLKGVKAVGNWEFSTGETMPTILMVGIYTKVENVGFFLNRPYLWYKDPFLPRTGVYFAVHNYLYWKKLSPTQEMLLAIRNGIEPWRIQLQPLVKVYQNTRKEDSYGMHWDRTQFDGYPYWWMHSRWGFLGVPGYQMKG